MNFFFLAYTDVVVFQASNQFSIHLAAAVALLLSVDILLGQTKEGGDMSASTTTDSFLLNTIHRHATLAKVLQP